MYTGEIPHVQVKCSSRVPTLADGSILCPLLTPSTPPQFVCNIWWRSIIHSPQYKVHPSIHTYREMEYYRVIETPIHTQLNPVYNACRNISDRFLEWSGSSCKDHCWIPGLNVYTGQWLTWHVEFDSLSCDRQGFVFTNHPLGSLSSTSTRLQDGRCRFDSLPTETHFWLEIPPYLLTLGLCWPFGRCWPQK